MKDAFVGAKIIPIEGEEIDVGILVVNEGKIVAIGKQADVDTSDCTIHDVSDKVITPGFIDAHSHVGLFEEAAGPGPAYSDGNEVTSAIVPYLRAIDAIFPEDMGFDDARRGGVTTMGVTHGSANPIGAQSCVVKSKGHVLDEMLIKAPAGVKFALGENPKRVGLHQKRAPNTRMSIAHLIREAFYAALDYRYAWAEYQSKADAEAAKPEDERVFIKPPSKDLGMETLLMLLDGIVPVRNHCHRADDIRTAIRLSEEFGYRLVIDHATEAYKIKDIIAAKGLPCVVGPLMTARSKLELRNRQVSTPGELVRAGIEVSITTDAPVIPINALRDTVAMAVREGLPEDKALATITINPARVLGVDDQTGSLKVGKDADFLVFNGDPLDVRKKVLQTYIDGKLVYDAESA